MVDPVGVTIRHHMTDAHDGVTAAARRGGKGSHCRGNKRPRHCLQLLGHNGEPPAPFGGPQVAPSPTDGHVHHHR